jgi:hypothetical protein
LKNDPQQLEVAAESPLPIVVFLVGYSHRKLAERNADSFFKQDGPRYIVVNPSLVELMMQSVLLFLKEHENTLLKLLPLAAFAVPFLLLYLLHPASFESM